MLTYFNSTNDNISSEIKKKQSELITTRNEKVEVAHSIGLLNCDLAAKQVDIDALQLQLQELDVLINTIYISYSSALSEVRRVQTDCDVLCKKQGDNNGVTVIKSKIDAELVSHGQKKELLYEEKAKLFHWRMRKQERLSQHLGISRIFESRRT